MSSGELEAPPGFTAAVAARRRCLPSLVVAARRRSPSLLAGCNTSAHWFAPPYAAMAGALAPASAAAPLMHRERRLHQRLAAAAFFLAGL